jgi:Ca-activated chloride channel family protein
MNLPDTLHAFHLIRPAWLYALPVLWGLIFWLARRNARLGNWSQLIDPDLLPGLRLDRGAVGGLSPWPWLLAVWTVSVLALSGPSWEQNTTSAYRAPAAWMLVLDLSPSMTSSDISPNRVTRARYALDDLLDSAHDARVGLVVFSDDAYTVAPLTDDVATVRGLLPPLAPDIMPSAGDQLAPALDRAGALLAHSGSKNRRVVVVSDGFSDPAAALAAAARLKSQGVKLDVVGVGSDSDTHVRAGQAGGDTGAALRQVAAVAGGRYVGLSEQPTLITSLKAQSSSIDEATQEKDVRLSHWLDGGIWLLPLLLLLAAPLARRGWL